MQMEIHEILFWKVFKNKIIFNEIFYQINNQLDEYDDPNKYSVYNRCKFRNTHSLQIMIKNDLLPLIKDKIKHNDHIEIDHFSIKDLFLKLSKKQPPQEETLIDNNNNINNNNKNKYKDEDYLEIIELLMKYRRDEFEITDLIVMATSTCSPDIIRLLVNEPYSIIIYPTTFEFAIKCLNLETIKELVNLESINFKNYGIKLISEEFKRKSARRKTPKTTIAEYIFNNPSLYSIPPLSLINNQKQQEPSTNKKLKLSESNLNKKNNNNNSDNSDNSDEGSENDEEDDENENDIDSDNCDNNEGCENDEEDEENEDIDTQQQQQQQQQQKQQQKQQIQLLLQVKNVNKRREFLNGFDIPLTFNDSSSSLKTLLYLSAMREGV